MVDHTHYYLHLFDLHGRGRRDPAPIILDPQLGALLTVQSDPSPPVVLNTVARGATSQVVGIVKRIISTRKFVVEMVPMPGSGATNRLFRPAEVVNFDNGGTAAVALEGADNRLPMKGQILQEHFDSRLTGMLPNVALAGDFPYYDRSAEVADIVLVATASLVGTPPYFSKGDRISSSAGGAATIQQVLSFAGEVGLAIVRESGTFTTLNTISNTTQPGNSGTCITFVSQGALGLSGQWVPYTAVPTLSTPPGEAQSLANFWVTPPNGNGTDRGSPGIGPENRLMHALYAHHEAVASSVNDKTMRMLPFCTYDHAASQELGQLGGVQTQVVVCSGAFPATGVLDPDSIGQTVSGPGGWSATVVGFNVASKYLFVRKTNGATLTAGTVTLSGGATVTGTGAAVGWQKGSTHWNALVAEISTALSRPNATWPGTTNKWEGIIGQPWETELAVHHPSIGCAFPGLNEAVAEWLRWVTDLRTHLGVPQLPVSLWRHRDDSHQDDIHLNGTPYAAFLGEVLENLPKAIAKLTIVRSHTYEMAADDAGKYRYLTTDAYLDLGEQFFRHMRFGQVSVVPDNDFVHVAVGVSWGQSQVTGYIPSVKMMQCDRDPDLWPSAQFGGVNTVDTNAMVWNCVTESIEPWDVAINSNTSWGTDPATCGQEVPLIGRMKRRFSEDPQLSTRYLHFKFSVPNSSLNGAVIDCAATWDPVVSARPETVASMTVSIIAASPPLPARARFTAVPGTFSLATWVPLLSVTIAGSALGVIGLGGNNTRPFTVASVYAVGGDGSWIEITGNAFVAETATFTLGAGPPAIFPEFKRQWNKMIAACRDLNIIPDTAFIFGEQGESDLVAVGQYEAAFRRAWDAIVKLCAPRLKGRASVAKCVGLLHSKTPFAPADDAAVEQMREIQQEVAGDLGNCVVVDPSDLPMEVNTFNSFPRVVREQNGVHHTTLAMLAKGFRVDRALATLGPANGIPEHPNGELAVDFGAVDGGTQATINAPPDDSGTDGPSDDGDAGAGTDELDPQNIPLVVEDGTGKADADSYLSVEEFRDLAQRYGNPTEISGASTAMVQYWLRTAARDGIDVIFNRALYGLRVTETQALEFPREGCFDNRTQRPIATNVVPQDWKRAQFWYAWGLAFGIDMLEPFDAKDSTQRGRWATSTQDELPGGLKRGREYANGVPRVSILPRMVGSAQPFLMTGDDTAGVA